MSKRKSKETYLVCCPECDDGVLAVDVFTTKTFSRGISWDGKKVWLDKKEEEEHDTEYTVGCSSCTYYKAYTSKEELLNELTKWANENLKIDKQPKGDRKKPKQLCLIERPREKSGQESETMPVL